MVGWMRWLSAGLLAGLLAGCSAPIVVAPPSSPPRAAATSNGPLVILISIDGFRADYLERGYTPVLSALAKGGARAERMAPSFPSLTFPNHYTIVTGKVPDHHGVVNNTFEDPALPDGKFRIGSKAAVLDRRSWDQATPIWVSAERHGVRAGTEFWPGSEADIQGVRPSYYTPFDQSTPSDARVDQVLKWLDLPAGQRPGFLTLYFDIVDSAGHHFGPDSPEVNGAMATVDAAIGRLEDALKTRGLTPNVVIIADHGMAPTPPDHHLFIDDWASLSDMRIITTGAVAGIVPNSDGVADKLVGSHGQAQCYRKGHLPAHLHYGTNPRIPPIVCIAEPTWLLTTHERDAHERSPTLGEHGYDPQSPLMGALFIANGPSIRRGVVLKPFANVDVYDLLARLLGLQPEPNDGTLTDLEPALR